jgi:hypothetical protein
MGQEHGALGCCFDFFFFFFFSFCSFSFVKKFGRSFLQPGLSIGTPVELLAKTLLAISVHLFPASLGAAPATLVLCVLAALHGAAGARGGWAADGLCAALGSTALLGPLALLVTRRWVAATICVVASTAVLILVIVGTCGVFIIVFFFIN